MHIYMCVCVCLSVCVSECHIAISKIKDTQISEIIPAEVIAILHFYT